MSDKEIIDAYYVGLPMHTPGWGAVDDPTLEITILRSKKDEYGKLVPANPLERSWYSFSSPFETLEEALAHVLECNEEKAQRLELEAKRLREITKENIIVKNNYIWEHPNDR